MTTTVEMIKELRERTGAPMMDCKNALMEAGGDMELAIQEMRKKGQAKAAKRAGKIAAEGMIAIAKSQDQKKVFMIELNCETDFVAREGSFTSFAQTLAEQGLQQNIDNETDLLALPITGTAKTFEQTRQELVAKIGENVQLRRIYKIESPGVIGTYLHGSRIGVVVSLDKNEPELARDLAMHIAAANPLAIQKEDISPDVLERETEVFLSQARETGKPEEVLQKIIAGRVAKFVNEVSLLGQAFVKDPEKTIEQLLKQHQAKVLKFARFEVGEGIEKEKVDFAEEVKAQIEAGK